MKVSEVSVSDGRMCAQLINLLKHGRWDLSGQDITAHNDTVRWVSQLAAVMAESLKANARQPDPASQQMKVKAMGPIGSSPTSTSVKTHGKKSSKKK